MSATVGIKVAQQGRVIVGSAMVYMATENIVLIYIDFRTKRAVSMGVSYSSDGTFDLAFMATEESRFVDESKDKDSMTVIELPEYRGFEVFASDGPARYTMSVALVRRQE